MTIKLLDEDTIKKIAAGEVIENPASVVKELVENSIDAQATKIHIEIREGGKSYIKVSDNGTGMTREDAELSVKRHSTSKIESADDLFNIHSLGFRGEALASIAAVSELTITTKTTDSLEGTQVNADEIKEVGCPKGTTVEVRKLFYNTPARKKYLGSMRKELNSVTDIVTRYALGFPQIDFELIHNSRQILKAPTADDLSNISNIYGSEIAKKMVKLQDIGYVSKPSVTKTTRNYQTVFVNNRYVKSRTVQNVLNETYQELLVTKRYPVALLRLTIDPKDIDVNVHPAKREIKFSYPDKIKKLVSEAVKKTFKHERVIPEAKTTQHKLALDKTYKPEISRQKLLREKPEKELSELPNMRIIGQHNKTFIVAEAQDALLLIDQHVAEERVNYEKFMKKDKIKTQELINPFVVELEPKKYQSVIENKELLQGLGFTVEKFGRQTVVVRSIPSLLEYKNKQIINDVFDELHRARRKVYEEKEKDIIMKACKSSVKANQELTIPQMIDLVKRLDKTEMPYKCPHGRPVIIKIENREILKRFHR